MEPVTLDLSENTPWPGKKCDQAREKVARLIERLVGAPAAPAPAELGPPEEALEAPPAEPEEEPAERKVKRPLRRKPSAAIAVAVAAAAAVLAALAFILMRKKRR